ncbi:hypothetical protein Drose_03685 [Dactylosporangium roseum]|uniref:DUF2079 domain-containing protein n=1 Tax=Dactylosporangium roseum TaxID=47989 RepID=A0ABY5Z8R3_9ACTN|nr:hypothetical protein [Dactylosporangium roseum]UWZ37395.1 hypothetical protein Drose_03685 [Dactylosporangium roseum]
MRADHRKLLIGVGAAAAAVGLFFAYLRMARAFPINGDGASNALQAWDMFHGNPLLSGWTLSDVSFYSTELIQYGLVQFLTGVTADQVHVTAAITYVLIIFVAAGLARGRATGPEAWLRVGVVLMILLVPVPGTGYQTLLSSPNHTGTAVPMLLAWWAADRLRDKRWMPAVVAVVLAWGAVGDPMVTFVGAVPLVLVSAVRALRARGADRVQDLLLVAAGLVSVVLSRGAMALLDRLGGFNTPHPPIELSPVSEWPHRAYMTARMLGVVFGTHRPGWHPPALELALSALHAIGFLVALVAVLVTAWRTVRGTADRVDSILVVAIACDLGAEIVSILSIDLMAARQISPVLPMSAVLAARVAGPWLAAAEPAKARRWGRRILVGVLAALTLSLVAYAPPKAPDSEAQEVADFLEQRQLRYGIGAYWASNNITVTTEREVTVAPVAGGGDRLVPFCWQSKRSMYDASHDARFVVLELDRPFYGTPEQATAQFGPPVERHDLGKYAVLLYDVNLLANFPPPC